MNMYGRLSPFSIFTPTDHPYLAENTVKGHISGYDYLRGFIHGCREFLSTPSSSRMGLNYRLILGSRDDGKTPPPCSVDCLVQSIDFWNSGPKSRDVIPRDFQWDKSRTLYFSNLFFIAWRRWREALWLPFQQPEAICSKRSGMNWGAILAYRIGACHVPWGTQIECLYSYRKKKKPDYSLQLILVHVLIKPSYWVIHFLKCPFLFNSPYTIPYIGIG